MSDLTAYEVLVPARQLIRLPEFWTTGMMCDPAGRRCALGAISAVLHPGLDLFTAESDELLAEAATHPAGVALAAASIGEYGRGRGREVASRLRPSKSGSWANWLWSWNDRSTHEHVMRCFDLAIAATAPEPERESAAPAKLVSV
jgi:hypothetical protein